MIFIIYSIFAQHVSPDNLHTDILEVRMPVSGTSLKLK